MTYSTTGWVQEKISKEELQSHLSQNPVPDVRVKTLATGTGPTLPGESDAAYNTRTRNIQPVQYNRPDLNLPGGKNYTESLFKLPVASDEEKKAFLRNLGATEPGLTMDQVNQRVAQRFGPEYDSSHWNNQPNVLAHTREDIRPDAQGVPGKFLQEVQSDWHQQGKETGYQLPSEVTSPLDAEYRMLVHRNAEARTAGLQPDQRDVNRARALEDMLMRSDKSKVPDAPFKDSWPDLTLKKHVLDVANSPDQQWLGFTKGATQANRYDLAKRVGSIGYNSKTGELFFSTPEGKVGGSYANLRPEAIKDYIGKELADKLLSSNQEGDERFLQGLDLTVGGEGMKHFYDNVLPSRLNKILKPFGGGVEEGGVQLPKPFFHVGNIDSVDRIIDPSQPAQKGWTGRVRTPGEGEVASTWPLIPSRVGAVPEAREAADNLAKLIQNQSPTPTAPAWMARITPEMKEAIKKAGLPLMSVLLARQMANQPVPSHTQGQQ